MKRLKLLFCITAIITVGYTQAQQAPEIEWAKAYGGSSDEDGFYSIIATTDGGYAAAGRTESMDGDVAGRPSGRGQDVWLVKLNDTGAVIWQQAYGGTAHEDCKVVRQTADGGYVIGATTFSENSGDITDKRAGHGSDYWVIRTDATGKILWNVTLGSKNAETIADVQQTADGGYIVVGNTACFSGTCTPNDDVTRLVGNRDYWIVKLNATGQIVWQKTYGGTGNDEPKAVKQTADGGYIVVGNTESSDGDLVKPRNGSVDYWILKLDPNGAIVWQKVYGGTKSDNCNNVIQTASGGYFVVGYSNSNDGDINVPIKGLDDFWVLSLDERGEIVWQYAYGSSQYDRAYDAIQTTDKGYVIAGASNGKNNDGDKTVAYENYDFWMVKTDSAGVLEWQRTMPGNKQDYGYGMARTLEGGYVLSGKANSTDIARYHNGSGSDLYIVKISRANIDSVHVAVADGGVAEVTTNGGAIQLKADVFPLVSNQKVTWSVVPGTGMATVDTNGLLTAGLNGTVWAKAVAVDDVTKSDSLEISLFGQVVPVDSLVVVTRDNTLPEINTRFGSLQLDAIIYPQTAVQEVSWEVIPLTGAATVDGSGLVKALSDGTVWVKAVSVSDGTRSDSLLVKITGGLGVSEAAVADIHVYPNPVRQILYISGASADLSVTLTDVYGRQTRLLNISRGAANGPKGIDVANLARGIYVIHFQGDGVDVKHKLICR